MYIHQWLCVLLWVAASLVSASKPPHPPSPFYQLDNPYPIHCDKPRKCAMDFTPHCLKGRKEPVFGHCEFQNAVCDEAAKYDPSFSCDIH